MPSVQDLGRQVKQKYPGQYDDLSDMDLGRRVKEKYPGAYDDFSETGTTAAAPAPQDVYQAFREGRVGEFVKERGRLLMESPQFRQNVLETGRRGAGQAIAMGGAMMAGPLAAGAGIPMIAAEPLAAMGGEAVNQLLSGERNPVDLLVAGGAPVALRGLFRAGRGAARQIGKRLPGAAAGLQERAIDQARALLDRLRPGDLDSLKVAAQSLDNLAVPLNNFRRVAKNILTDESSVVPALRSGQAGRIIGQLDDLIDASATRALPLRQVRDNLQEIGVRIGELRRQQGTGMVKSTRAYQALRQIYKGLLDDLDALPGDAPRILQEYRQALRSDFAVNDLETIIEKAISTRQVDGLTSINGRQIKRAWELAKDSRFLRDSFSAGDRESISAFIDSLHRLPPLPTPTGVAAGSMRVLRQLAGGAAAGQFLGGQELAIVGAGVATVAPRVIARAMMTEPGRRLLARLLESQAYLSPQAIQLLAAAGRQALPPIDLPASLTGTNAWLPLSQQPAGIGP